MEKGTFYGVGVGPGDPELITLKAVRAIERCPVIAAPETRGEKTLALDIARGAVDLTGKTILRMQFLMTRDKQALEESHRRQARQIMEHLDAGRDVAMLNLGDVSIYSTFSYILEIVLEQGYRAEVVAGVPSFCAVAALLQQSLTEMSHPLHIIPAGHGSLEENLALPGTKVLMKAGKQMKYVQEQVKDFGKNAVMIENCGMPDEKIYASGEEIPESAGYYSLIIVKEEGKE